MTDTGSQPPRLALRGIGCRFGKVTAVHDVSLELRAGEFVSLLGPSGCGKTLSSAAASLPPERRGMSMIFQSYAVWPHMTVAENVAFGLTLRSLPTATVREKVGRILDVVQLGTLADRYPAALSGGQQQRVALARAMVVEPKVLLLDEPLSNLDATLREEMRFEIRRLHDAFKITTVYVTHDQSEAMVTSDRIAVMNKGRVEQIDAPYALYGRPKTRFVAGFIGRTNFVEGKSNGDTVHFGGFSVSRHALQTEGSLPEDVVVSIRPQSIHLLKQDPGGGGGRCCVQGSVLRRAYLGEYWDYHVTLSGAAQLLRVTARPQEVFQVDERVWIEIKTTELTLIS